MTQLKSLKNTVVTALSTDSAVTTYCTTQFSKSLTIYVGIDANKPPNADDSVPYVAITQGKRARESNGDYVDHELIITTVIKDEGITTTGTITEFDGAETLEGLHELVEKCVSKTLCKNGYPSTQSMEIPDQTPGEMYPYFAATAAYTVRVRNRLSD